ncbi:unnamed protein product [Prunus armeniaca]|uniref:ABC transporter domain-containing protein n=1 Tax=Prunus armeniaca TaxID=36596 RepID=A0A6J5V3R4_PRUAR|nr:unnamed protein product [Prunus armeniaca]
MLGPTASKWYRASGLLFQLRPHRGFKANSFSTRTAFHGNPILLPKTLTSNSVRTTSRHPFHVNAFLSDASSAPSPPDGRSWFSTSPDLRNPTPPVSKGTSVEQITNVKIFRTLASYLWMKDNYEFRIRVIAALGFLVGAKVLNVQVPFLFKLAVDWLSSATGNATALASFTAANSTQLALFATPVSVLIGYGIARTGASAFNELRTAVFSKVALRTIRSVSRKVFSHLHDLDLRYHLSRETGALNRIIDRGSRAINFILSSMVFNVVPTILELSYPVFRAYTGLQIWSPLALLPSPSTFRVDPLFYGHFKTTASHMVAPPIATPMKPLASQFRSCHNVGVGFGIPVHDSFRSYCCAVLLVEFVSSIALCRCYALSWSRPAALCEPSPCEWLPPRRSVTVVHFPRCHSRAALCSHHRLPPLTTYPAYAGDSLPVRQNWPISKRGPPYMTSRPGSPRLLSTLIYLTERKILDGISFVVPAGKSVAIVGTSGSGKSTILRLLFRFFDTHSGSIKIDGQDIRNLTLESVRKSIGVVPQDTVLFNDTIFHNIHYGHLSATKEEVYDAARRAAIHDTIMKFPDRYSTVVGERGLKLSGGEKQRVALARAFLKAPPILLCDEATSALDSTTEAEILNALKSLATNRTSIFIAHRLTTAMQCDEIIVLENGKVVEQGPHDVLLSKAGRYAQLWGQQNNTIDALDSSVKLGA